MLLLDAALCCVPCSFLALWSAGAPGDLYPQSIVGATAEQGQETLKAVQSAYMTRLFSDTVKFAGGCIQ